MTVSGNREIVEGIYRDSANGKFDWIERYLGDDFVIEEADGMPYGGTYRGPQGFMQVFGRISETWEGFQFSVSQLIADGDYVVALVAALGASRKTGTPFTTKIAEIWRFKAGKIVELKPYYWDTHALHLLNA